MLNRRILPAVIAITAVLLFTGCVSTPPRHVDNLCHIFDEKDGWYDDARKAQKKWGSPIPIMMAFMYQESRFQPKAKPPRSKILWVIPGPRKSSAYGYSQAKDDTWDWYKSKAGRWGADRDEFDDAVDFVGWYNRQSQKLSGIELNNPYRLYLAYHEGHGGYNRGSYRSKEWLIQVAKKVSARAATYKRQLKSCESRLQSDGWWFF